MAGQSSLSAVSEGVFAALFVSALTSLLPGGLHDDMPQGGTFPSLWYEVSERYLGVLGTTAIQDVDLRIHIFSQFAGMREAQDIMTQVVTLLRYATPAVTGYSTWFCDHLETTALSDVDLNGIKVKELVGYFRLIVQKT